MVCYDPYTAQQTTTMTSIPLKPLSFGATYEVEKAALTSYEEGWDDFDGPIWPVGTNQCELQSTMVNISIPPKTLYFGAAFELEKAALTSYEEGWDDFDGPVWPIGTNQCELRE